MSLHMALPLNPTLCKVLWLFYFPLYGVLGLRLLARTVGWDSGVYFSKLSLRERLQLMLLFLILHDSGPDLNWLLDKVHVIFIYHK